VTVVSLLGGPSGGIESSYFEEVGQRRCLPRDVGQDIFRLGSEALVLSLRRQKEVHPKGSTLPFALLIAT
jgi:hypothetical protein